MKTQTKIIIALAALIFGLYLMGIASALTVESFSVSPNEIAPGKTADISILLKNNGENDAEDVNINLDLTTVSLAPYNSGSSYSVDIIESDDSKRAAFEIIALNDAKSGIYKIPVHVTYKEDSVAKSVDSLISVLVNSNPILEVGVEDSLLLKGQQNTLSVKIINKGLADVKFLDVELGSSTYYNIISTKKVYIGDVDSNDFQTTDYKILFNANAPSTVRIPVTLTYKDITSKEYTFNSDLSVKVYSRQEATDLGLIAKSYTGYIIVFIVVLIVIFIIYRIIRNRRRNREIQ